MDEGRISRQRTQTGDTVGSSHTQQTLFSTPEMSFQFMTSTTELHDAVSKTPPPIEHEPSRSTPSPDPDRWRRFKVQALEEQRKRRSQSPMNRLSGEEQKQQLPPESIPAFDQPPSTSSTLYPVDTQLPLPGADQGESLQSLLATRGAYLDQWQDAPEEPVIHYPVEEDRVKSLDGGAAKSSNALESLELTIAQIRQDMDEDDNGAEAEKTIDTALSPETPMPWTTLDSGYPTHDNERDIVEGLHDGGPLSAVVSEIPEADDEEEEQEEEAHVHKQRPQSESSMVDVIRSVQTQLDVTDDSSNQALERSESFVERADAAPIEFKEEDNTIMAEAEIGVSIPADTPAFSSAFVEPLSTVPAFMASADISNMKTADVRINTLVQRREAMKSMDTGLRQWLVEIHASREDLAKGPACKFLFTTKDVT